MAWAAVVVSICTLNFIWAVVVVKWSACLPSTTTIWVRFPLKSTNFLQKMFVEKKGNRQKEAHLKKLKITFLFSQKSSCLFKLLRSSQFIVPFTLSLSLSLSLSLGHRRRPKHLLFSVQALGRFIEQIRRYRKKSHIMEDKLNNDYLTSLVETL